MKPRILFLADINSPHTQKWAISLAKKYEIGIFSFNHSDLKWMASTENIICLYQAKEKQSNTSYSKLKYLLLLLRLFFVIIKFKPKVIHAHYASSYGLLGALTSYTPLIVSAWGTDLTHFPRKSWLHKYIIKFVLWRADRICVTSTVLQREAKKYSKKLSIIIPFGIDIAAFYKKKTSLPRPYTFGCVKIFEKNYNIDKVILAFSLLTKHYPKINLRLKLVGDGTMKETIFSRAKHLGLLKSIEFTGWVEHQFIPQHLNTIDALVNVSEYESFGVTIAEAMACEIPVIISKAEGFIDLVPDAQNAFVTTSNSPYDIFKEMESCLFNIERRKLAIDKSYSLVTEKFDWINNLKQMEHIYSELLRS